MPNDKSPENDCLNREFFGIFWSELKKQFLSCILHSFGKEELCASQRQAIIKLIVKKDEDKRLIKIWRPISLRNVDVKIISKALAKRLKSVLPSLFSDNQSTYVDGRFIIEDRRLIADVLRIFDVLNLNGMLVTLDIQNVFDSVNHQFLILSLKKYRFGKTFIKWIKTLLNNQESCIINEGITTKYFKLDKSAHQGDRISAYLYVLVLEIVFNLIKQNKYIHCLTFFDHTFLYTAYADDTTFLRERQSVKKVMNVFDTFSIYSALKLNKSKCVIAGIGVLKGISMELCGILLWNPKHLKIRHSTFIIRTKTVFLKVLISQIS